MLTVCFFLFSVLIKISCTFRSSYRASLGETAVACDFGPLIAFSKGHGLHNKEETAYPLYILYENGETFLIYINLQNG